MRTKALFFCGIAALLLLNGTSAIAISGEKKPKLVTYQKDGNDGLGLFTGTATHAYGYRDRQLNNGNWLVSGLTKEKTNYNGKLLAVYRASELARDRGKKYVKVIDRVPDEIMRTLYVGYVPAGRIRFGAQYSIEIDFVDAPDETANCATDVLRETCKTIEATVAMEEIAPFLKFKEKKK